LHIPVYRGGQFYCWRRTEYHEENHRPAYIIIFGELNINLELPPHWPYEREREREREIGGLKKMCIFKYHRMVGQLHRNTSKGKTRQNLKANNFISWQISFHSKHTEMDGAWIYRAVLKDTNTHTKKNTKSFILSWHIHFV
jgi:hypothetical protein